MGYTDEGRRTAAFINAMLDERGHGPEQFTPYALSIYFEGAGPLVEPDGRVIAATSGRPVAKRQLVAA